MPVDARRERVDSPRPRLGPADSTGLEKTESLGTASVFCEGSESLRGP